MDCREKRHGEGFTVIELMVAMTLGLVLGSAIISVFVFNRHAFARDETILRMQDDARQAMRDLANDLSMAGFLADVLLAEAISPDGSLPTSPDCGPTGVSGWIYDLTDAVSFVDNATGAAANASFSCIDASRVVPGTDVIAIKRVAGGNVAALVNGGVYLRTNGTLGLLYSEPPSSPPAVNVPAPFTDWEYRPRIYYVRHYGVLPSDGIPTLCRRVLGNVEECLAQGVENLQIEFGLDTNGNGEPNVFVTSPTQAELEGAVAARIYLLARSIEPDFQYTNDKTYTIGNSPAYAPEDNFYRRVYSVTVRMHNLRNAIGLRGL